MVDAINRASAAEFRNEARGCLVMVWDFTAYRTLGFLDLIAVGGSLAPVDERV